MDVLEPPTRPREARACSSDAAKAVWLNRFKPRLSILPKEQKALWPALAPVKHLGFTLYGGTAIALRLGHRTSADFDFSTELPLGKEAIYSAMPILRSADVLQESANTLVMSVVPPRMKSPVKVSFFATMGFGRFGEPEVTEDGILRVASLEDLLATKLKVILDRVEQKDYEDLFALVNAGVDLSRGLGIARRMFPQLSPEVVLKAMTYHEDVPGLPARARARLIKAAKGVSAIPSVERRSTSLSEQ